MCPFTRLRPRAKRSIATLVVGVAALVALACAAPGLPPAEPASPLVAQAVSETRALYLKPELIDRRFVIGALEALEARFDPVRFEAHGEHGTLFVGDASALVPLDSDPDPERFRAVLGRALEFVSQGLDEGDLDALNREGTTLEIVALNGALQSLDPYSTVFSARRSEDFKIRFSGRLYGIGARIGRRDGALTAMRVFPDSPADKGGLKDGDAIQRIDGEPTQPLSVAEAVEKIRGPAGTAVVLTVRREDRELELPLTRGEVAIPSVEARLLEPGVGYAQILEESRTTPGEFLAKVQELGDIEGLVLDLRGNTGGSMLAAAAIADYFLGEGTIVRVVGRSDGAGSGVRDRALASPAVEFPFPVAVLVDGGTASAAEILSGALATLPRVTLIGETTYGKGLVQRVLPLPDDNLLKLTVAEYLLSEDRAIHLKGLEPDLVLFPVREGDLGRVVAAPANAIPYVRASGTEDGFALEFATAVVKQGRTEARRVMRERAERGLAEKLEARGIFWTPDPSLPETLPLALEIAGERLDVAAGQASKLAIRVRNPNDFPVANAWIALDSSIPYLAGRAATLGTLAPYGSATAEIEVTVPDGLSLAELPVFAHVASGSRALQSRRLVVHAASPEPELSIDVSRAEASTLRVRVENHGAAKSGAVRVVLETALRTIESLEPGASGSVDLPIAGEGKQVVVALVGAGAQRAVEIPIPAEHTSVVPPRVSFARGNGLRGPSVRVDATSNPGLRQGWLKVDGAKLAFQRWDGRGSAELDAPLESDGYAEVQSKVEGQDGVAVTDSRLFIAE